MWRVEHFDEIDSTNSYLAQRARADAPEGLVALADFQSAGRGRRDRSWSSPPGASLLCSLLLRPSIEVNELQLVVAAVALAARAALVRLCGLRPQLKWPNDLIVGEHKVAGVLAEVISTRRGIAVVVGLGVNLTYGGPGGTATSVRSESGVTLAARGVLDIVLEEVESRRASLDTVEGRATLRAEYRTALSTTGQRVRVERVGDSVAGTALGVDDDGRLLVEVGGVVHTFDAGDVIHVRPDTGEST